LVMMHKAGAILGLPLLTKVAHHTENQVVLHEETPTKPYRILCSRSGSHWSFWFGLPTLTSLPIWVGTYRAAPLPIITTAAKDSQLTQTYRPT
jgi:hypothetical protein